MFASKRHSGFTTIEILVALGWASVILLAAFTGAYSVFRQNSMAKIIVQDNEFISSLSQEVAMPSKVQVNLGTPPPPPCAAPALAPACPAPAPFAASPPAKKLPGVGTKVNLTISQYRGFGNTVNNMTGAPLPLTASPAAPYVVPGTGGSLRLAELSYERKQGVGTEIVGGWIYQKHFIQAHIATEVRDPDSGLWRRRPERTIEVPVLVNPNDPASVNDDTIAYVHGIASEDSPLVNCATLGGVIAKDGSCKVSQNDFRGFYVTQIQVGTTTETCKSGNPLAGNSCTCPPSNINPSLDAYPYQSGAGQWSYTYFYPTGCGKKGTCYYPATNHYVDTYYICIDNQKNI